MYLSVTEDDDADLERRVVNFLQSRGVSELDKIVIKAAGGVVVLRGGASDSHTKHVCLECCRHVAGVLRIVDRMDVVKSLPKRGERTRESSHA